VSILTATTLTTAATDRSGLVWLVSIGLLVLALVTVCHLAVCWLRPFTRCRHRNPLRRRAVNCTRCDGTGYRVRRGRHVLNRLRDARRHLR
jgi:hypothetical protein